MLRLKLNSIPECVAELHKDRSLLITDLPLTDFTLVSAVYHLGGPLSSLQLHNSTSTKFYILTNKSLALCNLK